jgi:hypothetical protein
MAVSCLCNVKLKAGGLRARKRLMVETRNLDQYAEIHRTKPYGRGGKIKRRLIAPWVFLRRPKSILDYGSGQNRMVEAFISPWTKVRHRYDPAIPAISKVPLDHYELVICTDVMEHLDANEIDPVLKHIRSLCDDALLLVDTQIAGTFLPNGENAHATVQSSDWWLVRVKRFFPDSELIDATNDRAYIRTWKAGPRAISAAPYVGLMIGMIPRITHTGY